MIYAETDGVGNIDGWGYVIAGVIGAIPGIIAATIAIMNARATIRGKARTDTISEWQATAADLRSQLIGERTQRATETASIRSEYGSQIFKLREDLKQVTDREREYAIKYATQTVELQSAFAQIRRLQALSFDAPPGVTLPTEITSSADGTIYWASASVGPMFHWLPQEIRGQNIELLIPERLRKEYHDRIAKLVETGADPNPDESILTYGLTKQGDEFPIQVNLSGWSGQLGKRYINAEIRRRAVDRPNGPVEMHGPQPTPNEG
jgi:PAS domain S-box-containing protein